MRFGAIGLLQRGGLGREDLVGLMTAERLNAAQSVDTHTVLAGAILECCDTRNGFGSTGMLLFGLRLNFLGRRPGGPCRLILRRFAPLEASGGVRALNEAQRDRELLTPFQLALDRLGVETIIEVRLLLGEGGGLWGGEGFPSGEGLDKRRRDAADRIAQVGGAAVFKLGAAGQIGRLLAGALSNQVGVAQPAQFLAIGGLGLPERRGGKGAQGERERAGGEGCGAIST